MIAAAGAGLGPARPDMHGFSRMDGDLGAASRPATAMSGTTATSGPVVPERTSSATDAGAHPPPQRGKLERMHSGKARRDHSHHHSHSSRHHKDDQKTVGEYALHVLFTSVSAGLPCLFVGEGEGGGMVAGY